MENQQKSRRRPVVGILLAILIILLLVVGWHLIFPALGLTLAVGAGIGAVIIGTITALCIIIVLFFILTGVWIVILGLAGLIGGIVVIAIFPVLFPILVPLIIIMLLIALLVRRR